MQHELLNLIGGQWRPSQPGEWIEVENPVNRTMIGRVPKAGEADARAALEAADRAFPEWAALTPFDRATYLRKAAALVKERRDHLARLLTLEQGKPLRDAEKEIDDAAKTLEFFAEEAPRVRGEVIPNQPASARSLVIKQPIGVAVGISPWNYPVSLLAWKVGPALAAGCTFVGKPSSETPLAAIEFVRCLHDAGLPPGVVNVVTGPGSTVGKELVENPISKKVAVTGSTATGRSIMASASHHLKKISLELGGHSPLIVCEDANFEKAVAHGVYRGFRNMGQVCNSVNRIFVHRSLYEKYLEAAVRETAKLTIGDGLAEPDVDLGPMLNQAGIDKTVAFIEDAVAKGARLLCGGKKPEGELYANGYFFEPTLLADVTQEMLLMQEEPFGPVIGIAPFDTLDEAIALANGVPYGLVAYAYTECLKTAARLAEELESGTVCINNVTGSSLPAPYSGWKQSGYGVELSHHALDEYLRMKHVRIDLA